MAKMKFKRCIYIVATTLKLKEGTPSLGVPILLTSWRTTVTVSTGLHARRASHPTVGVALLGRKFSDRLSSPSEEPAVRVKILLV